jgi:rubrerythrin
MLANEKSKQESRIRKIGGDNMNTKSDVYQKVIHAEIKAQNLYSALMKALGDAESKQVFLNLIQIEKNHEEKITDLFKAEFPELTLNIDRNVTPEFTNSNDLKTPENALHFAIGEEEDAARIYLDLAEQAESEDLKKLFQEFASDEQNHKKVLEDEITRMAGLMIWFDMSELNGMMEY